MVAKASITKDEIYEAIEQYILKKYGIAPTLVNIVHNAYSISSADIQFKVPVVKA